MRQIGIRFVVVPADVDESRRTDEPIRRLRAAAGTRQSAGVSHRLPTLGFDPTLPVLGADTIVVLDDRVLGKPVDRDEARRDVADAVGTEHDVLTAVAVTAQCETRVSCRDVAIAGASFERCPNRRSVRIRSSTSHYDKAGAYGIQGVGGIFVDRIEGSYSGIMGLPLVEAETHSPPSA